MYRTKSRYLLTLIGFIAFSLIYSQIFPAILANTPPNNSSSARLARLLNLPSRGAPGRRVGAGSRGERDCPLATEKLIALVPKTNLGLTSQKNPSFWFYLPYSSKDIQGQFVLKTERGEEIYRTILTLPETEGIIKITLPKTVSLADNSQVYRWHFSVLCASKGVTLTEVTGGVETVILTPDTRRQLINANPSQRVLIYAQDGLWFDMLTELIKLRASEPQNQKIQEDWLSLWQSVGLESIAFKSLLSCCEVK